MGKGGLAIRVVDIGAPTAAAEVSLLRANLATLLEPSESAVITCDVGRLTDPDAAVIDALARLQLTARRLGCDVRLRNASDELHGLLALAGLCDLVGLCGPERTPITDPGAPAGRRAGTSARCRGRR